MTPHEALTAVIRDTYWGKGGWKSATESTKSEMLLQTKDMESALHELGFAVVPLDEAEAELALPPESDLLKRLGRNE